MAAIDFPSSPTVGQVVTIGGVTWTWDGVKWTAAGTGTGVYVPLTGGTMTGDLILNRDAQVALGAATKQQVDARGAGDNRLINGDMRIDQRNNGASGTAINGYTVDRWLYAASQSAKGTWQRSVGPAGTSGHQYALMFTSSSAYVLAAGDFFAFQQYLEADVISDFQWGTSTAQPVTLSFWAYSSLAGTFGGSIQNAAGTRFYPFSFSLTANTWTKVSITIPGDTTGTWVLNGNAKGLTLSFSLGTGATYSGPANVWTGANYSAPTGAVSVVSTNAATFYVTGVKLEIGSVATPYNRQSLAKSMVDCQRYYQQFANIIIGGYGAASASLFSQLAYQTMRALPTITPTTPAYTNASALVVNNVDYSTARLNVQITAAGTGYVTSLYTLSAEL